MAFALRASGTKGDIEGSPHSRDELAVLQDELDSQSTAANIMFAVTGALALSAVVVYFAESSPDEPEKNISVTAAASADGAWVSAAFRF